MFFVMMSCRASHIDAWERKKTQSKTEEISKKHEKVAPFSKRWKYVSGDFYVFPIIIFIYKIIHNTCDRYIVYASCCCSYKQHYNQALIATSQKKHNNLNSVCALSHPTTLTSCCCFFFIQLQIGHEYT